MQESAGANRGGGDVGKPSSPAGAPCRESWIAPRGLGSAAGVVTLLRITFPQVGRRGDPRWDLDDLDRQLSEAGERRPEDA